MINTYHIKIQGIVQGVGFRPMVFGLAISMQLTGYVKNDNEGLQIFINTDKFKMQEFVEKLNINKPLNAQILSIEINKINYTSFTNFTIIHESDNAFKKTLIAADQAICKSCSNELFDSTNFRYRYPFITCTECGPRYTILKNLPFDRENTSMHKYKLCDQCAKEYQDITDRRFYSQTNSCAQCGIEMTLWIDQITELTRNSEEILKIINRQLEQGSILALKGIGGYLLVADANNKNTINRLRERKNRPGKPFAVIYPDISTVESQFELSKNESSLLASIQAPIVLLKPKFHTKDLIQISRIAPQLSKIGVLLPYSPLLKLILKDNGKPIIATSANVAGSPLLYKDSEALLYLFDFADYVISYDREIIIPVDDSVIELSKLHQASIIHRRSRGYSSFFNDYKPVNKTCILALGAYLKNTFTINANDQIQISQYLGSSESYEGQQMFISTLEHFIHLYDLRPEIIITDLHTQYFSHQYGKLLTDKYQAQHYSVQHHQAHFAAVMGENQLLHKDHPILGVIWDGTGLGSDGNLWGGEFFIYEDNQMSRAYHLDYFPAIAGDKMALEPRIAALCIASATWPYPFQLKEKFTDTEWNTYQKLINSAIIYSSSMGRLFDAVSSIIGICDKQSYEGEAAMIFQTLAEKHIEENGYEMSESYFHSGAHYYRLPSASIIQAVYVDLRKNKSPSFIAAKFHYSCVCLIDIVAQNTGTIHLCFSGGVFQNTVLVDWIKLQLSDKYQLYFHKELSPNDENISFGQFVYTDNKITSKIINTPAETEILIKQ